MPTEIKAGLGLGTNLGDRLDNLRKAIALLEAARSSDHLLLSSVYETDPVDCPPDSPPFYNAAIEIETTLTPDELLEFFQGIELLMGRPADHGYHAPRTIDIDILYFGDEVIDQPELKIPHPSMREREFVMRPLADIRPDKFSIPTGECSTSCRRISEKLAQ